MQRWLTQLDRMVRGIITPVALNEQPVETEFNWRLHAAVGASSVLLFLLAYIQQGGLLYLFLIVPIIFLVFVALFFGLHPG